MVKTSRYLHIGPGGMNCSCCFPAPRSKDRRKQFRIAKRKAEREAMRQAEEDLIDDHWMELEELAAEYEQAYGEYGCAYDDWQHAEDPYSCYEDDYCYDDYLDDYIPLQSEQEKVARALSIALIGDDVDWRQHLTHAMDFMAAMKRNDQ